MLVSFIVKCKLNEFAIGFCQSKKMYNVTIYFFSKLLLLGHLPNLVGHCPMSDSNLQPWLIIGGLRYCTFLFKNIEKIEEDKPTFLNNWYLFNLLSKTILYICAVPFVVQALLICQP
jgi:hypothetical protein